MFYNTLQRQLVILCSYIFNYIRNKYVITNRGKKKVFTLPKHCKTPLVICALTINTEIKQKRKQQETNKHH
jgi:hypothetical protein